jgi:hypothetical protein
MWSIQDILVILPNSKEGVQPFELRSHFSEIFERVYSKRGWMGSGVGAQQQPLAPWPGEFARLSGGGRGQPEGWPVSGSD